jgi:hypothetical protein
MKIQFTNGYQPDFDQISRIMQYLLTQYGKLKIPRKDIMSAVGLSNRKIENLTSIMTGFGLVNPRILTLTDFGKTILEKDPYFERIETLWIIHYIVSSNAEWIVWYRIVNDVFPSQDRFEVDFVSKQYFADLIPHISEKTYENKLPTEISAVFGAYTRTNLSKLNIIQESNKGVFIKTKPIDVPVLSLLFCILFFKESKFPGSSAITIKNICQKEISPGLVFNLPEYKIRQDLENLHNSELIRLEIFGNLDQVRFSDSLSQEFVLNRIYRI